MKKTNLILIKLAVFLFAFLCFFCGNIPCVLAVAADNYRWVDRGAGITANNIVGIAVDPTDGNTVYIATPINGIYKSTDGGSNWSAVNTGLPSTKSIGWNHLFGNLLTIDPNNSQILYTNMSGQVYKTSNGGTSWANSNSGIDICASVGYQIAGVLVDPTNSNHLFAAHVASGCGGGVYESTNQGTSWTRIQDSGGANDMWPIAFDPADMNKMYVSTVHEENYRSTDAGHNWTAISLSSPAVDGGGKAVAIHPTSHLVLIGTSTGMTESTDYGVTWSAVSTFNGVSVMAIQFAPSDATIAYALTENGKIYKSTDSGSTWALMSTNSITWWSLAIHPTTPTTIYLGSKGNGMYKSTDSGTAVSKINTGLPTGNVLARILYSNNTANSILAGVDGRGLYQSTDRGVTWQLLDSASYVFQIAVSGNTIFYVGSNVRRSSDGGSNWSTVYTPASSYVSAVAIDPNNSQIVYIGQITGDKILKSTNGGDNWTEVGTLGDHAMDIRVDPLDSNLVYVATVQDYFWKSTDSGQTWAKSATGVTSQFARYLTLKSDTSTTIYLSTQWGGVYQSTNQGNTWTKFSGLSSSGTVYNNVVIDYANSNNLYVSELYTGVYQSTNAGNNWSLMTTTGFPSSEYINSVCQDPSDSSRLLLGFYYNGVYAYENYIPKFHQSTFTVTNHNGSSSYHPGDTLDFTFTLKNTGWADGNSPSVRIVLPSSRINYVSNSTTRDGVTVSPDPTSSDARTLTVSTNNLAYNESIPITFQVSIETTAPYGNYTIDPIITSSEDTSGTTISSLDITVSQPSYPSPVNLIGSSDCANAPPGDKAPQLYAAIPQNESSILLYFTDAQKPYDHYALLFGPSSGNFPWGATSIGPPGTRTYLVKSLTPNTTYYFKVRGGNGCAAGSWSNELSGKTGPPVKQEEPKKEEKEVKQVSEEGTKEVSPEITAEKVPLGFRVKIKVIDIQKQPLAGVKVVLSSTPHEGVTDKQGMVVFENVEKGEHKISLAYQNYEGEKKINLEGEVKEINLTITMQTEYVFLSPIFVISLSTFLLLIIILLLFLLLRANRQATR